MADMKRPIEARIAEVQRELALRRNVYPARVAKAAMTQAEADEHTARMEAVLETLQRVRRKLQAEAGIPDELRVQAQEAGDV